MTPPISIFPRALGLPFLYVSPEDSGDPMYEEFRKAGYAVIEEEFMPSGRAFIQNEDRLGIICLKERKAYLAKNNFYKLDVSLLKFHPPAPRSGGKGR